MGNDWTSGNTQYYCSGHHKRKGFDHAGTLSYENVTDVNVVGFTTVQSGLRVGTGGTVGPVGSGIVTYYGDGQYLTGISLVVFRQMHKHPRTQLSHLIFLIRTTNLLLQDITTITVSGGTEGDSHTVRIINAGVSTVGFSTYFLFPSGSQPSLPNSAGSISLLSFTVNRVGLQVLNCYHNSN